VLSSLRIGATCQALPGRERGAGRQNHKSYGLRTTRPKTGSPSSGQRPGSPRLTTKNRRALAKLLGLSTPFLQRLALGELVPARPLLALIHMLSVHPELGQALEAFWRDYDAAIQVPPPALEPPTVSDG
jgi:hypothetical protein